MKDFSRKPGCKVLQKICFLGVYIFMLFMSGFFIFNNG